jgi:hypothetical protein
MLLVVLVAAPAFVLADPAAPDFRLEGARDLGLRADALYRDEAVPRAGPTSAASSLGSLTALESLSMGADNDGKSYSAFRIGPLFFIDDLEDLGTGFTIEGAFGFRPISLLAIEIQSGYFRGEDDSGSSQGDVWGIPLLVNAKLTIPILILEIYGGLGVGGYYIHSHADAGPVDDDEDDFVFGGNAFVGVGVSLGPVMVGVEGKYILTTDVDGPFDTNFTFEGFAAMAVVELRF